MGGFATLPAAAQALTDSHIYSWFSSLVTLGRPSVSLSFLGNQEVAWVGLLTQKRDRPPRSSRNQPPGKRWNRPVRGNLKQPLDPPRSVLSAWAEPAKGLKDGHLDQERI